MTDNGYEMGPRDGMLLRPAGKGDRKGLRFRSHVCSCGNNELFRSISRVYCYACRSWWWVPGGREAETVREGDYGES